MEVTTQLSILEEASPAIVETTEEQSLITTVEDTDKKLSANVGYLSLTIILFNNNQKNLIYFL